MYRHLWILPDSTEIFSGQDEQCALQSVTLTEAVNSGGELAVGCVCAGEMKATLLTPEPGLSLAAGEKVRLYRVDEEDQRTLAGTFYLEKPVRPSAYALEVTAYDAVSRLDKDLTQWLAGLDAWPYSLGEFANLVCAQCGLTLINETLPNGDFYIQPFAGEGVTGRQLMQWVGQIAGRFLRATEAGSLEFAWYAPNTALTVAAAQGNGQVFYYQDALTFSDYQVAPIEKVQLRQNPQDVGTVWPDEAGEKNTYILENNPLLAAQDGQTLLAVAQTLYEQLCQVTYTPCKVTIPATGAIRPGDILTLTDLRGKTFTTYVMTKVSDGQRDTLEAVGSHRRDSTTATNSNQFRALSGKVLNLRTDVDGILAENADTKGNLASVTLELSGIRSQVQRQGTQVQGLEQTVTTLSQTADGLSLELGRIRENGTDRVTTTRGYTFDDDGLHISRSDSDMENTLDHTGMYVRRYGQVLLQANNQGVEAADVTVRNYLIIGDNSRLEDYTGGRTACYYTGKEGTVWQ